MKTFDLPTKNTTQWIQEIREKMAEMSQEERTATIHQGSEEFRAKMAHHRAEKAEREAVTKKMSQ